MGNNFIIWEDKYKNRIVCVCIYFVTIYELIQQHSILNYILIFLNVLKKFSILFARKVIFPNRKI